MMLKIQEIPVEKLKPWEDNPRVNDHAVDAVAASIRSFGFNIPVLYDQRFTIVAGHTRWKAAAKLGLKKIPAIRIRLNEKQRRAFSVADNKTAEIASWDFSKLRNVLKTLHAEDIDLNELGYSDTELRILLDPEEEFDWSKFDERLREQEHSDTVLFPVKIRRVAKASFKEVVEKEALKQGIKANDSALVAGIVIGNLLGVQV